MVANPVALTILLATVVAAAAVGGQPKRRRGRKSLGPATYERVDNILIATSPGAVVEPNPDLYFPFVTVWGAPGATEADWDVLLEAVATVAEQTDDVMYGVAEFALVDEALRAKKLPETAWSPEDMSYSAVAAVAYRAPDGRLDVIEMPLLAGMNYGEFVLALSSLVNEIPR